MQKSIIDLGSNFIDAIFLNPFTLATLFIEPECLFLHTFSLYLRDNHTLIVLLLSRLIIHSSLSSGY